MARKKGTCKNHPEKESSRRCYHCKEYICSSCQEKHEHHLFCGWFCYSKYKFLPIWKWLKLRKEFSTLLLLVLLSDIILYVLLKEESTEPIQPIGQDTTAQVDTSWMRMDTSRVAFNYALSIELEMQGAETPVLLWKNGKFITSIAPEDGKLNFGEHFFTNGSNNFSLWSMDVQGRSTLIDSFTVFFSSGRLEYLKKQVSRIYTSEKNLALTFDGGSSNKTTMHILDTLKSRNVKCTMFLTGNFIRLYPEYVQRMLEDGHEIGNHSWSHPHLTNLEVDGSSNSRPYVDRAYIKRQLIKTDSLFYSTSSKYMVPLWRAPYGELNNDIVGWAAEAGFKHINWSSRSDSWDWVADTSSELYRSAEDIYTHYIKLDEAQGLNGRIFLMHLGSERDSDFPYSTLGQLIDALHARGYRLLTVSELLKPSKQLSAK